MTLTELLDRRKVAGDSLLTSVNQLTISWRNLTKTQRLNEMDAALADGHAKDDPLVEIAYMLLAYR